MTLDYIINFDSYTWFFVHVIWILDLKARRWATEMICFLGKSRQKGERNFHGLWDKFEGFHPPQIVMEAFPCRNPGPEQPIIQATHRTHFSPGSDLSGAVQHVLVVLMIRDVFDDTLMTNSIMASEHILQTCHHLMGYFSLCTAIAMVPYLPSSLASASFSFYCCLYSFTPLYIPQHFQSGEHQAEVSPLGWSIPWAGCWGELLSSASASSVRALWHRNLEHLLPWSGMPMCMY